jgi:diguanylate cyclase (GGDEF)-like protein
MKLADGKCDAVQLSGMCHDLPTATGSSGCIHFIQASKKPWRRVSEMNNGIEFVSGKRLLPISLLRRGGAHPAPVPTSDSGPSTDLPQFDQESWLVRRLAAEAQRRHRTFAIVAFKLDGFNLLRESLGYEHGEEIIQRAAYAVKSIAGPEVVVSRHETDGFTVVLAGLADGADTAVCVQQILDAIAVPYSLAEQILRITATAGIAMFPRDGADSSTLCRNARGAMRESKAKGPGMLRFHSGNVTVLAKRRMRLETDLRHAIDNNELSLHFQPQFDVADGHACGVEALARWFRSDGNVVEPRIFIPLAEKTQLIGALGDWVLKQACETVHAWRTHGSEPVTLCVNVSAKQINGTFAKGVQRLLKRTGFPAMQLELEITESALISNANAIIECFRRLKTMGIRIAIDDFGTGYSSLNYLSRLPVDRLKLDKSLVHNLTTRWKDVAIVRAVIELGKELGIAVIAEGVETEQQFQVLKNLGCLQVQGYLLARPTPQTEARDMIKKQWGGRNARPDRNRGGPGVSNAS